jgi:hypothetical protein
MEPYSAFGGSRLSSILHGAKGVHLSCASARSLQERDALHICMPCEVHNGGEQRLEPCLVVVESEKGSLGFDNDSKLPVAGLGCAPFVHRLSQSF